jgi:hexokinase
MGKGFLAEEGLLGQDLGEIIKTACRKKGLHVELSAIVNDSSAALLSEAYITPSTRFSLILGTGVNIAVHLPVTTIDQAKFGDRPSSWHEKASHVIVNTELGMFGHDILPLTKWDKLLKAAHPRPEFQPLEHLVSGYYLGEICRLALLDAIPSTGVFGGTVPLSLEKPYSLDTETLSLIEAYVLPLPCSPFPCATPNISITFLLSYNRDTTPTLSTGLATFTARHPTPGYQPTAADLSFLRALASHIARRSASVVAASLFALWELKAEAEQDLLAGLDKASPFIGETEAEVRTVEGKTTVAFNGSVVEQYPGYQRYLQGYIDALLAERLEGDATAAAGKAGQIALVEARESSLRGAAVALACLS